MKIRNLLCIGIVIFIFILGAGLSSAQERQDPGAKFLEEQDREKQLERLKRARPGQEIKVDAPEHVEREKICFSINTIRLRGVSVIDPNDLLTVLSPYKDTCMGQNAIGSLIQLINKVYVEAGFITTRAYVPQQDLQNGVLLIDVIEGRLEGFVYRVVNEKGEVEAGLPRKISSAFPIKPGDIFQLRHIEQGLDQINRLASSKAKVDLMPGSQAGTSLVVVTEYKADLIRGVVSYDNKGSDTTGVDRIRLSLEADDLMGLNDTYSLSYLGTENTNVLAYNYSIPYGYWEFSSYGSYSESLSPASAFSDLFNQTANANIKLERLLIRDAKQKVWGYLTAGYYWNSRFINLAQLTPQNRTAFSAGIRAERYFERGVFSYDIGMTFGTPLFGADEDEASLDSTIPRTEFDKFDFILSYLHRYKNGNSLNSSLIGQWSNRTLYSNEQLTIGGWDSVRGFHGDEASGERGVLMKNELNLSFPEWSKVEKMNILNKDFESFYEEKIRAFQPFVFLDAGYIENLALKDKSTLVGAGFGVKGQVGRVSVDASVAFPLTNNNIVERGDIQGLINVSFKLF